MKIAIDASRANKDFKTGTEWYSYYLIKYLVEIDRKNQYILYSDKPLSKAFLNDLKLEKNKNVKVKVLKWPFKIFWTLGRMSLEMIFNRPDVLFVPAHVLSFFSPKKTITTIHDIAFTKDDSLYKKEVVLNDKNFSDWSLNLLVRIFTLGFYSLNTVDYLDWSTKRALKKARKIITVSDFTRKEVLEYYKEAKKEKISVVYNGFNDDLYREIDDQKKISIISEKYGLDFPFFLYVGRLEKKKNIHRLIEAFSLLKEDNEDIEEKLVLVGSAGLAYDEIKYMIKGLDLEDQVISLGWVEEEDLPYIFNKAEAFIFPSLYEGFGIPVLQAMASGLPVLSSDLEVLKEVSGDSVLFFNRLDPVDLASKMKKIIKDDNLKEKLKFKGLRKSETFSWRKCAQETLKEIESL
jgi:glycosyltransferase involved in cell wall biosynthesis